MPSETTYRHLLSEAKKAMKSILAGGQSYSVDGVTFSRANMKDLREYIRELEELATSETDDDAGGTFLLIRTGEPR